MHQTLHTPGLDVALYDLCLHALGAITYARPALLTASTLDGLKTILATPGLPLITQQRAGEVWKFALVTSLAPTAVATLEVLLLQPELKPEVHALLIQVLVYAAAWRMDLMHLEKVSEIAAAEHLAVHRDVLLGQVIGRLAFVAPATFTPALLHRLALLYGDHPWFACLLSYLDGRSRTSLAAAETAVALLGHRFPLRTAVRTRLGTEHRRVLIVHNIDDGQGDETVRVGTLTQALLDFHPQLEVVLVTKRVYLYDNARVTVVPITDAERVDTLLHEAFDGVVYFHEPVVPSIQYRPELGPLVQAHVREHAPFLFLVSQKGHHRFVFETVTIGGMPYEVALSFDTQLIPNIYEPTCRLLAELGLSLRAGEEAPGTSSPFTGEPCPEAAMAWKALIGSHDHAGIREEAHRPLALVNPFGGRGRLKGYARETLDVLVRELCDLVAEGFFVVLVPNGTPWGNAAMASEVLALLPRAVQAHVVVAPDPGPPGGAAASDRVSSRQGMPSPDQIMRVLKYFVRYADLVVTVEGWMMHLAYHLGKPYRLLLLPHSHAFHWHPYGAGPHQVVVTRMSPTSERPLALTERLCESERPPLPSYPRKDMLGFVLRGLAQVRDSQAISLLLHAYASPDGDVRAVALAALAHHSGPQIEEVLLTALKDRVAAVRAIAAEALLTTGDDWTSRLGSDAEQLLRCHRLIAAQRWREVLALSKTALRALSVAVDDEDPVIRREASWAFWRLVRGGPQNTRTA
jgi:ADP-heptose:LPS heptosyltransferase